jgi:hypothetical protein
MMAMRIKPTYLLVLHCFSYAVQKVLENSRGIQCYFQKKAGRYGAKFRVEERVM